MSECMQERHDDSPKSDILETVQPATVQSAIPEIFAQPERPPFRKFISADGLTTEEKEALRENAEKRITALEKPEQPVQKSDEKSDDDICAQIVKKVKSGSIVELGKYLATEYIGEGGIFYVLKGHNVELDERRPVAIKIPKSPKFHKAIERHKEILLMLEHPHIPDIIDARMEGDISYVVEELIEGETLADMIARNKTNKTYFSEDIVIDMAKQILSALQHMHERGVVHRDVKPQNVIVNVKNGHTYITDFNISDVVQETSVKNTVLSYTASTTRTGGFTDLYASPEQRQGKQSDHRGDLYSLGVLLFELLTNEPCLGSDVDPQQFNAKIQNDFTSFFARALKSKPEDRFQNATEMQLALNDMFREKNRGKYGGGTIFYCTERKLCAVTFENEKQLETLIYYSNERIINFCISPDKRSIAVLERDFSLKTGGASSGYNFRVFVKQLKNNEPAVLLFEYTLWTAKRIFWTEKGIYLEAKTSSSEKDYGFRLCSTGTTQKTNDFSTTEKNSSPDRKYRLDVHCDKLLLLSNDTAFLDTREIAPFATAYYWTGIEYPELFKNNPAKPPTTFSDKDRQRIWYKPWTWNK